MKKHFVTFLSPGTFVHEETTLPIASWNPGLAVQMADGINERHGATPFAFYFSTRGRTSKDLDSKVIKQSGRYFLGGRIMSLAEVEKEMPNEKILQANMRGNNWQHVIVNDNSWRTCQPFEKDDVRLEYTPPSKRTAA